MTHTPLMSTYPPATVTFVRGKGSRLWDDQGEEYLDLLSGLAVTSLGHSHPAVAQALAIQAQTLLHTSNLFGTVPGPEVARTLDRLLGGGGQVFFTNSGAEANECALKLARKWGGRGKHVVVSALGSFHGRTLATLHATGQPQKWEAFQPLPEGFRHVAWNDLEALEDAIDPTVAAVLLEPVQGEGGVNPATAEYFQGVRKLCDERALLFIVDEVQTGLGRTGEWFGHQHFGVVPDVVTMAKALGNGVPIGACWAKAEVARAFEPGDHATTYGGQPLAAAAARAVLGVMEEIDAPAKATAAGARLTQLLKQPQFQPMPFEEQTASIFAGTNGYLDTVATTDVSRYEAAMIAYLRSDHAGVLKTIRDTKDLGDDAKKGLVAALEAFAKIFA